MPSRILTLLPCLALGPSFATRAATIPVTFQLGTSANAVAVQFDVTSSAPVQFASLRTEGLGTHLVDSNTVPGGARRFLIYSTANTPLSSSGTLKVTVTTATPAASGGFLTVSGVLATNATGNITSPATASPNALPVALSVSPASFLAVATGSAVPWAVEALDPDGQVTSVTFSLNGNNVTTDTTTPFGGTWNATTAGDFAADFTVTDNRGAQVPVASNGLIRVFSPNPDPFASYSAFQNTFFLPEYDSAKDTDAYGIGLPNLAAFALGINPTSPQRHLYPAWTIESDAGGRYAVYRAVVRTVSGLTSDFQVSSSMTAGSWQAPQASWVRNLPYPSPAILIPRQPAPNQNGAVWKYFEGLTAPSVQGAATWKDAAFSDTAWASGPARLGINETGLRTALVGNPANVTGGIRRPYNTSYFRRVVQVPDPSVFSNLRIDLLCDDGSIIWINGVRAWATNMPAGTVTHNTAAVTALRDADEGVYVNNINAPGPNTTTAVIPASLLVPGSNLIAVEVHQSDIASPTSQTTSSDLNFDLELTAIPRPGLTQKELRIPLGPAPAPSIFARLRFTLP